jgi:hypothetical protein
VGAHGRRTRIVVVLIAALGITSVTAVAPAQAQRYTAKQRAHIRHSLLRQVKRSPRILKSKRFLRKAALVNFNLPITIRLRTQCDLTTIVGPGYSSSCAGDQSYGTALNVTKDPSATVNLGPSLGQREISLGGSLAGVVQFRDTYDGGALGNVMIKLLPGNKKLRTTSVPLLWNPDISDPTTRFDESLMQAVREDPNFGSAMSAYFPTQKQGCGDYQAQVPPTASPYNPASTHNPFKDNTRATSKIITTAVLGIPPGDGEPGYNALFADVPYDFQLGTGIGLPGFPFYTFAAQSAPGSLLNVTGLSGFPNPTGPPNGFLPVYPSVERLDNLKVGSKVGDNEILGPVQNPFPVGSTPGGFTQPPNVRDTVLRTNALTLGIAPGGISVNQSTGTSDGGSTPGPQGSQDVTLGYSGGEANLFGNIPGKNHGIDVTVNLQTTINGIARIVDQDLFQLPLLSGDAYPAGLFNCRQIWTGAVKNFIPGVRLTGNLRIAPAITKDGKVRIAKATVQSDVNSPDRVALSACVYPYSAYVANNDDPLAPGYSTDAAAAHVPTLLQLATSFPPVEGFLHIPGTSNALPAKLNYRRYSGGGQTGQMGDAPSNIPCNSPPTDIVVHSGLTGLAGPVTGINNLADGYTTDVAGDRVSVAGDITVHPIDVDVLLGDQ